MQRFPFRAMGSPCEVTLAGLAASRARTLAKRLEQEIARLERRYSRFRADSDLTRINAIAARGGAVELDEETAALIDYAATCHAQSNGLFDITAGVLRAAWRFDGTTRRLPEAATLAALCARVGFSRLVWERPWLRFPEPGLELDLGGIVKEYAADRLAALAAADGARYGF
ncbi:MAG: FAD:protein FMN transferase, partial [Gammaproteobacteria bacterium]